MVVKNVNCNIYAAYRGDDYIGEGTLDEIAVLAGVQRRTVQWCLNPAHIRRVEEMERRREQRGMVYHWASKPRRRATAPLILVLVEER